MLIEAAEIRNLKWPNLKENYSEKTSCSQPRAVVFGVCFWAENSEGCTLHSALPDDGLREQAAFCSEKHLRKERKGHDHKRREQLRLISLIC